MTWLKTRLCFEHVANNALYLLAHKTLKMPQIFLKLFPANIFLSLIFSQTKLNILPSLEIFFFWSHRLFSTHMSYSVDGADFAVGVE